MTNESIRVLVIEDNPADAELSNDMMQEYAPCVLEMRNADTLAKGLDMLAADHYSAVLVDLGLPDSKGLATLFGLLEPFPELPIVVLSGLADEQIGIEAVKRGAQDYLVKGQVNWSGVYSSIRYAIERKRMETQLRKAIDQQRRIVRGTVDALVRLTEQRDRPNAEHQRRVAQLAGRIAEEMGYSEDQIDFVRTAGALHDVGKASVPSEILNKPGGLAGAELALEQHHVQSSYDVLKRIEFPWPVAEVILQHHERMDGSGYPRGLSGDRILPEARMLMVADVMDGMSTPRSWRPQTPGYGKAIQELAEGSGTLYDASVADACLRIFREKGFRFN